MSVDSSDIVVGIASWNDAATIGAVTRAVSESLCRAPSTTCIVVADGGSTDGTFEAAVQAAGTRAPIVRVPYDRPQTDPGRPPYHGLPGRPLAIRAVLEAALERRAKACAVFDASVTSVTPEWTVRFIEPVVSGSSDYVSPCYTRHAEEGVITKAIVYPLFRALYGARVRQPASGEFGCSTAFMRHVLDYVGWDGGEAQSGIDVWLIAAAAVGKFRVSETALGPRTHTPRMAAPDLSTTLAQVVGALFADAEMHASTWQHVRGSTLVPISGDPPPPEGEAHLVDIEAAIEAFRLGCRALCDVWAWVVPPRVVLQLQKIAASPPDRFHLDDGLWAQIIYDFALAHRERSMPREHLLGSLTPLYLGYLAGFAREVRGAGPAEIEARIERLCLVFEGLKPQLMSRWRWPERFRA